ncbi:hypothetical protein [Moraxella bovis]|uniref:hypothetical protein n=1 Tax=Moraxella bovis TaxID=476 RepID=UPI0022268501|nr:hypothetical protein [Moraxella bovis]UZA57383.1 hypothetical protein LP127_01525 [Moraxella bovis]
MNTFNGYVTPTSSVPMVDNTLNTSIGNYYEYMNPSKLPITNVDNPFSMSVGEWLQNNSTNATAGITKTSMGQQIKNGWGDMSLGQKANTIMGTAGTLLSAYNAYKANKLAKEQFNHAKGVHAKNWDAQRKQTNSQLEDRQRRRVEEAQANGRSTTSVGDYMAKYGI